MARAADQDSWGGWRRTVSMKIERPWSYSEQAAPAQFPSSDAYSSRQILRAMSALSPSLYYLTLTLITGKSCLFPTSDKSCCCLQRPFLISLFEKPCLSSWWILSVQLMSLTKSLLFILESWYFWQMQYIASDWLLLWGRKW